MSQRNPAAGTARATPAGQVELITYPDSLGGSLTVLADLLAGELDGLFPGGVHVLPPFPSSADRGFAPTRYDRIEPVFGTWDDLEAIARRHPVTLDVMVNHISRHSPEFADVVARGPASPWIDAFLTPTKIWPQGWPPPEDLALIHLRKPDHPFTDVTLDDGSQLTVWTTFAMGRGPSQQIDLDVRSPVTWELYRQWFAELGSRGVARIRLDAVGYITKRAGTPCFMVEPDIWERLDQLSALAAEHGLTVLPEVHAGTDMHRTIAARGYASYDFALPALILDALIGGRATQLKEYVATAPGNQVTMLDCHDGIPVYPDLQGLLAPEQCDAVVEHCRLRGANFTMAHDRHAGTSQVHQINCTYHDAAGSAAAYLVARAIQLFTPGVPQVYYVGLLAGSNVPLDSGGEPRSINRHNYTLDEIRAALVTPTVQRQLELIGLRNRHPGFAGRCSVLPSPDTVLSVVWSDGARWCRLDADLAGHHATVTSSTDGATVVVNEIC